ncbi:glycosyltransferase [Loigolactobacillus coryniformis]|uniref:glycosyltransferase family 2 protein n=1 Tax=Lactobacillaceae TaxID=33958 RepID=UPI0021C8280B|nr:MULTISPECIES: glycosyltransferase family 2 protein [Lactobacillaceae]MCG0572848.1 glycosyl transferase group 2 [Lactiplantibacillus plantarum]MCG0628438.1 glycosyl transferase group 2 [Lactiplantibacillus plantarum]MCG0694559.1 glycosyl transferase group 2 [Lactiplantibacillus plantarum]MCU0200974.1 glycosyltransferase [Levilactobacillus brevis]MDC4185950.1 glycosyltransferase [Loigolactobacillus coryniformis]
MKPKVSIVVPVYKTERFLDRCMISLVNQTFRNIEIILIDDGSPDGSPTLCDKWAVRDERITVVHKKNGGLSSSRNCGIDNAIGEYLCFVDSDDFIEKNLVERTYSLAKKTNADVVIFSNYNIDSNGDRARNHIKSLQSVYKGKKEIHHLFNESIGAMPQNSGDAEVPFSPWGRLYKKELFTKNNVYFKNERYLIYEDLMLLLDIFPFINKALVIDEPLYNYCENEDSLTHSDDPKRFSRIKKQYLFLKRNYPYRETIFNDGETLLRFKRTMQSYVRNTIIPIVKNNNFWQSRRKIKLIMKDSVCDEILKDYPIKSLPIKNEIFDYCLKYRLPISLIMIVKLNDIHDNVS